MKTVKIFLGIAGFVLTGIFSGQLFSQNNSDVLYYTAYYNAASSNMEYFLNEDTHHYAAGDQFVAPVVRMTYFAPLGLDPHIAAWPVRSAESSFSEAELVVEEWMTAPFGNSFGEAELVVEEWMTTPFGNAYDEPELVVEEWMTAPFGNAYDEPELEVEPWMTRPFGPEQW